MATFAFTAMDNDAYSATPETGSGDVIRQRTSVPKDEAKVPSKDSFGQQQTGPGTGKGDEVVIEEQENVKMERQVGLPSGVAFIVGSMIGSGIFISPKNVLLGTGSVGACLLVWAACGVLSLLGCVCYAELGTMIPKSGGEYTYIKESLGPVPAFLNVWTTALVTRTSSMAIQCLTFSRYVLAPIFDDCGPPDLALKLLAAAVMLTIGLVNCHSARLAARVQVLFTVVKVSALVVVIIGGIVMLIRGKTEHISTGFEGTILYPSDMALAFYGGLYAYGGWDALNDLTEEIVNPTVNLVRSMMIGVPLVTVIYLLTNISYLTVLSTDMLLASPAVAQTWAELVLGAASVIIPLSVACSTFGALNSSAFRGSRLLYVAAREGHFPSIVSYVHVHQLTPWCSLIFTTITAVVLMIPGNVVSLINFLGFASRVINTLTFIGLIVMRFTRKDWERPIKAPIVIPIIMLVVSVFLVVAPIVNDPRIEIIYSAIFIAGGLIFYVPFVTFKLRLGCMDTFIKWVQLFLQVAPSRYEP